LGGSYLLQARRKKIDVDSTSPFPRPQTSPLICSTDGVCGIPVDSRPVGERKTYLNTLEKASVGQDIVPFVDFLAGLVRKRLAGEPLPPVPKSTS
jgi:hypothetical protein